MVVTRPGEHRYANPNTALGAGETSLNSPLRSATDYDSALGQTALDAGEGILGRINDVINFIKTSTGIDLSGFGALLGGLSGFIGVGPIDEFLNNLEGALGGIDITNPGAILLAILENIGSVVQAIITALTGSTSGATDPLTLLLTLLNPFAWLQNSAILMQQITEQFNSRLAVVENRVDAIQTQPGVSVQVDNFNRGATGFGDPLDGWTNVLGELLLQAREYVRSPATAAGIIGTVTDPRGPTSHNHKMTMRLVSKMAGACRGVICSDAAMTNYAAVEVRASGYGADYARLVTGSAPNVVIARRQQDYLGYGLRTDVEAFSIGYDEPANTFYVERGGILVPNLVWEDVDNEVSHNSSKLKVGIVSNVDGLSYAPGFGVTDFIFSNRPTGAAA